MYKLFLNTIVVNMEISLNNNKLYSNDKDILKIDLINCKVLKSTNEYIIIKSPTLQEIYSKIINIEKKFETINRAITLEEEGIIMKIKYTNKVDFSNLIEDEKVYNINCNINSIENSELLFRITKITNENINEKNEDIDIPEFDIHDMREYLIKKIKRIKGKLNEFNEEDIKKMNFTDLNLFEDNLHYFFQNNI